MNASLSDPISVVDQLRSLTDVVRQLQQEVGDLRRENTELRRENAELRQQVFELRCDVAYWKSMHARAVERNQQLQQELEQAQAEIRQLKSERFGKKSEKQTSSDRSNQLEDPQDGATSRKRGQQPGRPAPRRRDYSHLPAREEVIDVPTGSKVCKRCSQPFTKLGTTDDCAQIEIEVSAYRRVIRRQRYRRTCQCDGPRTVTAPLPLKLLPKSIYGTSVWTHLLLEKFYLQRPTHRTIEQLRLLGLSLAAGTIADGFQRLEPLLQPIYHAIRQRLEHSRYFRADETRWRVFVEKAGKVGYGWWLWLFASEDAVVYVLDPSRSHQVPQSQFPDDAAGVLMVDRYSGYKAMLQVKHGQLLLAFCWAHVRRDFVSVGKGYPELKEWALAWLRRIRELYRLQRNRLQQTADSSEFQKAHAELRAQMAALAEARDAELAEPTLRQPCRKVLRSLQEHWTGLARFVDDPRIPLDNNASERLLRNPAVGRKNYYGSGAEWAGRWAMMMFSILATLSAAKLNPQAWLQQYFEACAANNGQSPANIEPFLPWNMAADRLAQLRTPDGQPIERCLADTS